MDAAQVSKLLARTTLFHGASSDALEIVGREAVVRSYRKGTIVVSEGEPAETCFVLAEGSAKVFVSASHGQEMVLATLRPPEAFGEVSLLDGGARSASVEALESLTVAALSRECFLDLLHRDPAAADAVLGSVGGLSRRLTSQAADLVFLDLEGRVAKLLATRAAEVERSDGEPISLDLGLTQRDIAAMVGGSRQSVNQILHALQARGFVEVRGRTVDVLDLPALDRRASG